MQFGQLPLIDFHLYLVLRMLSFKCFIAMFFNSETFRRNKTLLHLPRATIYCFRASAEKQLKGIRLEAHLGVENALNASYRDYLNRQRYFADELGRNFTVGLVMNF